MGAVQIGLSLRGIGDHITVGIHTLNGDGFGDGHVPAGLTFHGVSIVGSQIVIAGQQLNRHAVLQAFIKDLTGINAVIHYDGETVFADSNIVQITNVATADARVPGVVGAAGVIAGIGVVSEIGGDAVNKNINVVSGLNAAIGGNILQSDSLAGIVSMAKVKRAASLGSVEL